MGILTQKGRLERLEAKLKKETGARCIVILNEDDRSTMTENGRAIIIGTKDTVQRHFEYIKRKGGPIHCITIQVV